MAGTEVNIPWAAWFGDGVCALDFPDDWDVQICAMRDAPALSPKEMPAASMRPMGAPPLRELASHCHTVAIAVDDLSRPTPAYLILPFLIEELASAGISPENISFVISLGSHTALTHEDLVKKLGAGIVARHRVVNHDCYNDLVDIGVMVGKVPVKLNATFMAADLKILLGSVVPHAFAGFSGGAKMVLPGLSNIESIEWTHKAVMMGLRGKAGTLEGNRFRTEFERVARHAGVSFAIQTVVNSRREIAGIFAGDIELAHREAAKFAGEIYATPGPHQADVAILNAYPKDDELLQAENALMYHHTAPEDYLKEDGLLLITSACSLGMGHHGLFGPNQRLYRKPMPKGFLKNRKLAAFMPGVTSEQFHQVYWEGYPHFSTWQAARAYLQQRYPNGGRVAVVPCSSIQICKPSA
jgi:nickel-dependent lactate racemase